MKNSIIKLLILVFLVIIVYNAYQFYMERKAERERIAEKKEQLEQLRKLEETRDRLQMEHELLEIEQERLRVEKERAALKQKREPQVSSQRRPTARRTPRSTVKHRYEVQQICQKCNCTLLKYNEQGYAIYIEVAGPDHSSVSDILDPLVRAGVVNFKEHREKFGARMIRGKRMYVAAYTLRW